MGADRQRRARRAHDRPDHRQGRTNPGRSQLGANLRLYNFFAAAKALDVLEMMMTVVAGERAPANRAELMQLHRAIGMVRDYLRSTGRRQSAATRLAVQ
jgi:hypothetical protein